MTTISSPWPVRVVRMPVGLRRHAGALGLALLIGVLAAAHGGYFPTSCGWSTLVLAWGYWYSRHHAIG